MTVWQQNTRTLALKHHSYSLSVCVFLLWHVFFLLSSSVCPGESSLQSLGAAALQGRCCSVWSKHHQEPNGPVQTALSLSVSLSQRERERDWWSVNDLHNYMFSLWRCPRVIRDTDEWFIMSGWNITNDVCVLLCDSWMFNLAPFKNKMTSEEKLREPLISLTF